MGEKPPKSLVGNGRKKPKVDYNNVFVRKNLLANTWEKIPKVR